MRIAYLCADRGIPVWGTKGASIHVRSVAQSLSERGHQVDVLAMRAGEEPPTGFEPRTFEVPFDRTLKSLRRSIEDTPDRTLSNELYSLLLNSSIHDGLVALEEEAEIEAIYERYSLWSIAGLRFARSRQIPFLLEVNAPLVEEQETYRQLRLREAAEGIERFLFQEADAIFVPSEELEQYIVSRVGDRRRLYVTPNGVDVARFAGGRGADVGGDSPGVDRFDVAFVGSLKPWHGVGVLLRAFEGVREAIPGARLLIVGDGPGRPEIEQSRARFGEEAVLLAGAVPHSEIPLWLERADVGVAPYPELEDFYFSPLKVVEYMAAGLPVVASSVGQLRDLVQDGKTGLLVRPGDAESLASALVSLAEDRRLRLRMGRRARERAERRHDWSRVTDRIEKVLAHLHRGSAPGLGEAGDGFEGQMLNGGLG
jgi:glycosyltransferase involved in cell wall biosynthesis